MVLDKIRGVPGLKESENKTHPKAKKQNSKKPQLHLLSISQFQKHKFDVQNLTNQELVRCCVEHSESNIYWKEFYSRFNSLIDACILKTLGRLEITRDKVTLEIADEISFMIMEKIHGKKILVKAVDHPNLQAWLTEVVRNVVWSWNRVQKLRKNAMGSWVEKCMKSIDEPIGIDEDSATLGDMIADSRDNYFFDDNLRKIQQHVNKVLNEVENLPRNQRLIFKISLIFYNSLEEKEIHDIAAMRSVVPSKIIKEVNGVLDSLVMKNGDYEHQQDLLFIKFADLERLRRKHHEIKKNFNTPAEKLKEIEEEIKEKEKDLENRRRATGKMYVYPTAEEIAQILGIPNKNIGVWLHRAKKSLQKIELQ